MQFFMKHELIQLPYDMSALEPYMSSETLEYHYGKHHQTYVNKLNELIAGTDFEHKSLEDIIKTSTGWIFNNAAQIWNHNLFWNSLQSPELIQFSSSALIQFSPNGRNEPASEKIQKLAQMIDTSFGSFEDFQAKFKAEALSRFGSGWAWLLQKGESLEIYSSPNAENPLTLWGEALLGLDVWEHSYYIDYRNDRAKFVDHFWNIVDWEIVAARVK